MGFPNILKGKPNVRAKMDMAEARRGITGGVGYRWLKRQGKVHKKRHSFATICWALCGMAGTGTERKCVNLTRNL